MSERTKKQNFSPEESEILLELITKYQNILENKKTTAVINKKKEATWRLLTDEFNQIRQEESNAATIRTSEQLQTRYKSIKASRKIKVVERDEVDEPEEKFFVQTMETYSPSSSCSTSMHFVPQVSFKRPQCEDNNQVLKKVAKHIDQIAEVPVSKEMFASFGEHVAEKLRCMSPEMVPICQKLISDVIFYGDTQNLSISAHVVTE